MSISLLKTINVNRRNITKCTSAIGNVIVNFNSSSIISENGSSKFIMHSDLPDLDIPKVSIPEYVFNRTDKWPKHIATECALTGRKYTFDAIRSKARNLGRSLRKKLKLQPGDVVGVLLPNCPEFSISVLGILKSACVVTTLNPIYTPDEICRQLKDSNTKAIITLTGLVPLARKSAELTQQNLPILGIKTEGQSTLRGVLNFDEFTENCDFNDAPTPNIYDIAFLPYSSGTTGLPKGVQLTHHNVVANMTQFDRIGILREATDNDFDTLPAVLPKFHIYGLVANTLHPLEKGVKTVSLPYFTPEFYLSTIRKYKPQVLFVAPPIILFLGGHPSVTSEDLQCLRTVISGAAPLGKLDEDRFRQKIHKDINIMQGYGLTESSPLIAMMRVDLLKLPTCGGSIGRPVPNTSVKIIDPEDPDMVALGPNQLGELLVRGPQIMKGYHNQPKETEDTLTKDGWLRTGDLMYVNDDNLLVISDRLKELIKVKGFQVPPAELEEIIRDFPAIEDAAVIGVDDSKYGEVPKAFIVLKRGESVDLGKLNEFVTSKVAPYKQLKGGIQVVDSIPKNASGKILRRTLKEQYEN